MWTLLVKLADWLKSPRQCAPVFLASVFVLLLPRDLLKDNGLDLISRYRGGVFLLAILSGATLMTEGSIEAYRRAARRFSRRRFKQRVLSCIPTLRPKEKEIIGWLLANNQKVFTNTPDGGHAATLISMGLIVPAVLPGQAFSYYEMPFKIPDDVWEVLFAHKANFPYSPPDSGKVGPHPWRKHWAG